MPGAALLNRGKITPVGATVPSVEPWAFGIAAAGIDEPYNFGDVSNASAASVEPFDFGLNAAAAVVEPFMFGSNASASISEPFDFGSSGGARGHGVTGTLGTTTPTPAAPLLGWRDR